MLSPSTLVVAANDGLAYAKHPCVVLILLLGTSATGASFSLACSLFCGWALLQALVGFTPSLCRGGGGCAATMLLTSVLLSATAPPPPRAGTLYFELSATADFNISIGASRVEPSTPQPAPAARSSTPRLVCPTERQVGHAGRHILNAVPVPPLLHRRGGWSGRGGGVLAGASAAAGQLRAPHHLGR